MNNELIQKNENYIKLLLTEWFYIAAESRHKAIDSIKKRIASEKQKVEKTKPDICYNRKEPLVKTRFPIISLIALILSIITLLVVVLGWIFKWWFKLFNQIAAAFVCGGGTLISIILIGLFIHVFDGYLKAYDDKKRTNKSIEYGNKMAEIEYAKYTKAMASYNEAKATLPGRIKPLQEEIDRLNNEFSLLNLAYEKSMNFLYPKYRSIVCVCQFTQYLESGRCESFEGPYGCYNLFEQELRMNLIINKLDVVIKKLDVVIQNQIEMLHTLNAIEKISKNIENNTKGILEDTKLIKMAELQKIQQLDNINETLNSLDITVNNLDTYYRRYN